MRRILRWKWIDFGGRTALAERRLGAGLARQHRATADQFGWHRHNTIGATPQRNTQTADWIEFLRRERLGFQLDLAARRGLPGELLARGRRLLAGLEAFFPGHRPGPSLLHGDLWSGNWGADADGSPYIFDPAVYHGDREADLAMTRLFGGFGRGFYTAYEEAWPLPRGWERRVDLYNLYHLLNHFNLFRGGLPQPGCIVPQPTAGQRVTAGVAGTASLSETAAGTVETDARQISAGGRRWRDRPTWAAGSRDPFCRS